MLILGRSTAEHLDLATKPFVQDTFRACGEEAHCAISFWKNMGILLVEKDWQHGVGDAGNVKPSCSSTEMFLCIETFWL